MFRAKIDDALELRLLEPRHAPAFFEVLDASRAYLRQWLSWIDGAQSTADIMRYMSYALSGFAQNKGVTTGIWYQNQVVGMAGFLHPIDWENRIGRITGWLAPDAQGQGIATRVARRMLQFAFEEMDLNRVELRVSTDNEHGKALAERLGMQADCMLRCGEWVNQEYKDVIIYGMLARDWQAMQKKGVTGHV